MARTSESKKILERLISTITGFEKGDENFTTCKTFVTSNLRFHKYLDVDSHKVKTVLDGLYEKFHICSEISKGEILKEKISQFFNNHLNDNNNSLQTDIHYAIVSFLLDMSNSPTCSDYAPFLRGDKDKLEYQDIDWYSYLTEDLDPLQTEFSDSTEESDTEVLDNVNEEPQLSLVTEPENQFSDYVNVTTNQLSDLLVSKYWSGEQDKRLYLNADLSHDWNLYQTRTGLSHAGYTDTYMTEYQMVRELLWMFSGSTELFLFLYDNSLRSYSLRPGLSLTHTTKSSLASLFSGFLEFGSQMMSLRKFCCDYIAFKYPSLLCRTFQAFSVAVLDIIRDVDVFTEETLKNIKNNEKCATLLAMQKEYEGHRQMINVVYSIYISTTTHALSQKDPALSPHVAALLSKCNSVVRDLSLQCKNSHLVTAVLNLFLQTLQPYLDIIDEWVSNGNLNDIYYEFILRKINTEHLDETFWNTAVELTTLDTSDSESDSLCTSRAMPDVLMAVIGNVAVTGKSMEMLSRLGKLSYIIGRQKQSLYESFISKLSCQLSSGVAEEVPAARISLRGEVEEIRSDVPSFDEGHPLLMANLIALEKEAVTRRQPQLGGVRRIDDICMTDLTINLSKMLGDVIHERCCNILAYLLKVINTECRLPYYLSLVKKVFLLDAGDMMYDFCWDIFDKISHEEEWLDSLSLNVSFRECLQKYLPDDVHRFSIVMNETRSQGLLPINALENISIHFEVDWPIDVVYDSDCEKKYNELFQFIMQIKLAKHLLDQLCFKGQPTHLPEETVDALVDTEEIKRKTFYAQRIKLLHVVNGLHDYVMTTIVHSNYITMEQQVSMAVDLESIIKAHRLFVSSTYAKCFLHENTAVIKDCIHRLLNSAIVFYQLWTEGVHCVSLTDIDQHIEEANRCILVLASFITALNKTGSLPYLEYLILTLKISTGIET